MDKYVWVEVPIEEWEPKEGYHHVRVKTKHHFEADFYNTATAFFKGHFSVRNVTHVLVKKPIEDVIKERMPTEEYWKKRCELAEKFILESPCDPDIHEDQIKAYNEWTDFKGDKLLKQD